MSRRFVKKKAKGGESKQALALARSNRKAIRQTQVIMVDDDNPVTGTLANAPVFTHLVTDAGATGEILQIKSIWVTGWIKRVIAGTTHDPWRVDLILDRFPAKALPTATLIYGTATPTINRHVASPNQGRFKILRSFKGILSPQDGDSALFDGYVKLNLKSVSDTSGTYAIANMIKNALHLCYWQPTIGANFSTFSFTKRAVFTDQK